MKEPDGVIIFLTKYHSPHAFIVRIGLFDYAVVSPDSSVEYAEFSGEEVDRVMHWNELTMDEQAVVYGILLERQ